MKLEQQVGRIFTKATNVAADTVLMRAQRGKPHDERESLELIKIKLSALEQAILLVAGKVDEITHPGEDAGSENPIGKL